MNEELVGYCGTYCGSCGMYRGRVYAKLAQELLECVKAAGYPGELTINPAGSRPNIDFDGFVKGLMDSGTSPKVRKVVMDFLDKPRNGDCDREIPSVNLKQ